MAILEDLTGTLEYNGQAFTQFFSTKVSSRYVYSDSGRVVKWVEYTLTVDALVVPDDSSDVSQTTDIPMRDLRLALSKPGQFLVFQLRGFGSLTVNGPGGQQDVNWGPKPQVLSAHPVGHNRAWRVQWSVVVCLPEQCEQARTRGILAMEYETTFEMDAAGAYTITHTGYLEIAQTRINGGKRLFDTADRYREEVSPKVPLGFERVTRRFTPSKSKNRLDFSIVDRQCFAPLPAGFCGGDIEQSIESRISDGFRNWNCSIRGNLVIPMGTSKEDAYDILLPLVLSKMRMTLIKGKRVILNANKPKTVLPTRFSVTDGHRQNRVQFAFDYRVCGTTLSEMMKKSGLFAPLPGVTNQTWRASLTEENGAWTPRGPANITLEPSDDELFDLCSTGTPTLPKIEPELDNSGGNFLLGLSRDNIDADASWLFFSCSLEIDNNWGVAVAKTLKQLGFKQVVGDVITGLAAGLLPQPALVQGLGTAFGGPVLGEAAGDIVTQLTAAPMTKLRLKGKAIRLFHPIPIPMLGKFNGMKVGSDQGDIKELKRNVRDKVVAGWEDIPIHRATWVIEYVLPKPLSGSINRPRTANYTLKIPPG